MVIINTCMAIKTRCYEHTTCRREMSLQKQKSPILLLTLSIGRERRLYIEFQTESPEGLVLRSPLWEKIREAMPFRISSALLFIHFLEYLWEDFYVVIIPFITVNCLTFFTGKPVSKITWFATACIRALSIRAVSVRVTFIQAFFAFVHI